MVPELAEFNVEFNGSPAKLTGAVFSHLYEELQSTWDDCVESAEALDLGVVSVGILPTIHPSLLNSGYMSEMVRYQALNDRLMALRDGEPLHIDIEHEDHLNILHSDVMMEAATTSFQIHLQCKPNSAVKDYNAALVVSAPVVALAANSPFLFGKSLWHETRVPLFEQSVALGDRYLPRVTFGQQYIDESLFELYLENQQSHVLLLPYVQEEPMMKFSHLRFHNGTIWRWNRPLIGFDYDGTLHIRIEHRTVPAGPSIIDCMANCAAFLGFTKALAEDIEDVEKRLPFEKCMANFYRAAREGLDAKIDWFDGEQLSIQSLILDRLLPAANESLSNLHVPKQEIDRFLGIVDERVRSKQNGAKWQLDWVDQNGKDFPNLTLAYMNQQKTREPVHRWHLK